MITAVTLPGGAAPNEDWYACTPDMIAVLDGVTVPSGMESGCRHGTPWYVRNLGTRLLMHAAGEGTLAGALASAITEVAALHSGTCNLDAIGAPSSALAVVRARADVIEWLVLADVTIMLGTASEGLVAVTDNRVAESMEGLDAGTPDLSKRIADARRESRNVPGGYWVAAADAIAARHARTGVMPASEVLQVDVLTDGAARIADLFGMQWPEAIGLGPEGIVRTVRILESADSRQAFWPRLKDRDDATAVRWLRAAAPAFAVSQDNAPCETAAGALTVQ
jgi:hypothetical protein